MGATRDAHHISPTAHYTGYVWTRHGLSHPSFVTAEGRALHAALRPLNALSQLAGGPTLDQMLLARHRRIDAILTSAIEEGRISQVVEIAAGLSPRGWRFAQRYSQAITYLEADLPAMAARKRRLLAQIGSAGPHHRVVDLDATAAEGPSSLGGLAGALDSSWGTAIVTEGLLNYFDVRTVLEMWGRFASTLQCFPVGLYVSDLHLKEENSGVAARAFTDLLSLFVRGKVHLHFGQADEATAGLRGAGFATAALHWLGVPDVEAGTALQRGARLVRVIEASTDSRG